MFNVVPNLVLTSAAVGALSQTSTGTALIMRRSSLNIKLPF